MRHKTYNIPINLNFKSINFFLRGACSIASTPQRSKIQVLNLLLAWPLCLFTIFTSFHCSAHELEKNILVLDLETTINLALKSEKLFDAESGLRTAALSEEVSLSEFDWNISPNGETGYYTGGTSRSGLKMGSGVDFEKKLPMGTQITLSPSLVKSSKKFHSNFTVYLSQPILRRFGKEYNFSGIRRAEFGYRTASRAFYKNMNHTVLQAIELLYEVAKQQEIVKLNQESHQRLERFWKANVIKEKIGFADALDVYRSKIELKQTEDTLNQSKECLHCARDLFCDILSLPHDTKFIVKVSLEFSVEEWNLDEAIETALQNRIEIHQGVDQLNESRRLAVISKQNLLPDINIVMDYSNLGIDTQFISSCRKKRENRFGIGLTTSTDTNNVLEKSAYKCALINIETIKRFNLEMKKSIILDVKRTLRACYRSYEKIILQSQQTKNSEGGLKLAKAKFLREFATNFDVIQAEKAFHAAQVTLISALIEHRLSEYRLRSSMGILVEKHEQI